LETVMSTLEDFGFQIADLRLPEATPLVYMSLSSI
jgi:hypothetical protein